MSDNEEPDNKSGVAVPGISEIPRLTDIAGQFAEVGAVPSCKNLALSDGLQAASPTIHIFRRTKSFTTSSVARSTAPQASVMGFAWFRTR